MIISVSELNQYLKNKFDSDPFLLELYNKLHLNALQKIFFNPMSKEEMTITHAEHQKILQFIKDKNPEGEQFIKMHLWKRREH